MRKLLPIFIVIIFFTSACTRDDSTAPLILIQPDAHAPHYRTIPFVDPGCEVADDYSCADAIDLQISNNVEVNKYGTYNIMYTATDEAGNINEYNRPVDIILPISDYYDFAYSAYDTCTSGNYFYTGLAQDCDCPDDKVIFGNISNFGPNATFPLPINGQYNHMITLDTTKLAVTFFGTGVMSPAADTIFWEYVIMDSISTDACRSVWIK